MSSKANNEMVSLDNLSDRARQVVEAKRLQGTGTLDELRALLEELGYFDHAGDAIRDHLSKRKWTFTILTLIGIFASFFVLGMGIPFTMTIHWVLSVILTVVWGAGVLACIVMIFVYGSKLKKARGIDLMNDFRLSLVPALWDLEEDVKSNTPMSAYIDMSGLTSEKITSEGKIDPGRFKKVTQTVWWDPWCRLSFKLVDGSTVVLDIHNMFIKHDRRWRKVTARGKVKFKHKDKWKKLVFLKATLHPDEDTLDWDDTKIQMRAQMEKVKYKDKKGGICRLARKYKYKDVNRVPSETVPPAEILGMLMHLYSMTAPAEKRS